MKGEDALQCSIVTYLRHALPPHAYLASIPNGAHLAGRNPTERGRQMSKLKATGLRVGAPDLFVLHAGTFIGLEVKTDTGVIQASQKAAQADILLAGGKYHIVRSIDYVASVLAAEGVTLRGRV